MSIKALKPSGVITALTVLIMVFAMACGGGEPRELEIPVSVEDGKMTPETIEVKQDDKVTLKIQSDDAIEFHLHTYDIEKDVEPGTVVDLFFVADATGRFRITSHHLEEEQEATGEETGDHEAEEDDGDHETGEEAGDNETEEETDIGFLEVRPR